MTPLRVGIAMFLGSCAQGYVYVRRPRCIMRNSFTGGAMAIVPWSQPPAGNFRRDSLPSLNSKTCLSSEWIPFRFAVETEWIPLDCFITHSEIDSRDLNDGV